LFSLSFSDFFIFSRAQKYWRETHLMDPLQAGAVRAALDEQQRMK
jgi:hypothetical protein